MAKSKFKSLAATTAITLATVGTPVFAEETTQTVEATNDAVVSTTEAPKVETPKTSSDVKPALDAQTQVVSEVKGQVNTAQDAATQADQAQATAQADVDAATQAVKDAESSAANATPANIAANQADQQANAQDTEDVNAQTAAQTQTVSDAQTAVDTAQANKDAADADVAAKDASVKAAQAAIDGTGVEQAQANLTQAKTDVKTATTDVDTATKAVDTAKKADADRDAKIKAAETDVKTKSDAVTTASSRVTAAQGKVSATTDTLTKANDAVTKAQDAVQKAIANQTDETKFATAVLAEINDKTGALYFKDKTAELTAHMTEFNRLREENKDIEAQEYATEHLLSQMLELYIDPKSQELVKRLVGSTAFNKTYKLQNGRLILSKEDYTALNIAFASQLNAFRKISGFDAINQVTEESVDQGLRAIESWNKHANLPENSDKNGSELRHSGFGEVEKTTNAINENISPTGGFKKTEMTFTELNTLFVYNMLKLAFQDAHANWGHYHNLLQGQNVMMGLYQNNSGNGAGGAYFTHSYAIPANAIIVYSQYSQDNSDYWSKVLNTVTKEINDYKELLKNDKAYRELIANATNFDNTLRNRYYNGETISDEEYAERDRLSQLVTKYEDDNNIKSPTDYDYTNISSSSRVKLYSSDPQYVDANVDLTFKSALEYINDKVSSYQDANANFMKKLVSDNKISQLQAALAKAQADQTQAQTASDQAKAELTKASSDYAKALELKTQAEKVLASATATPLQTQVAENNLRLAKIALQNAQAREVEAQKAVDNFSADLATKKAKLEEAKAALTASQADAATKATALETAKAELVKQQGTLDSLNKDKAALLAEKDRLVEEAKALSEELKGYMNASAILETAKANATEKEATLKDAMAKAKAAHNVLKDLSVKLAEEESKLAELQAEYDRLKDLEDKAKSNVIATLPNGSVMAVPKDAPTVGEKPMLTLSTTTVNNTNQAGGITVAQMATGEKVSHSRVARAKALPQTGERESLLALFGVAVLSSLGLTGARRKRRG